MQFIKCKNTAYQGKGTGFKHSRVRDAEVLLNFRVRRRGRFFIVKFKAKDRIRTFQIYAFDLNVT